MAGPVRVNLIDVAERHWRDGAIADAVGTVINVLRIIADEAGEIPPVAQGCESPIVKEPGAECGDARSTEGAPNSTGAPPPKYESGGDALAEAYNQAMEDVVTAEKGREVRHSEKQPRRLVPSERPLSREPTTAEIDLASEAAEVIAEATRRQTVNCLVAARRCAYSAGAASVPTLLRSDTSIPVVGAGTRFRLGGCLFEFVTAAFLFERIWYGVFDLIPETGDRIRQAKASVFDPMWLPAPEVNP
jgi:hypothetical protein